MTTTTEQQQLYLTVKDDHPELWHTGEPCECQEGDDRWARTAMRVPAGGAVLI